MTKQDAAAAIREKFPGVKVLLLDTLGGYYFVDGIGVELMIDGKPKRNAVTVASDTPENWRDAAQRLIRWLDKEFSGRDISDRGRSDRGSALPP